MMNFGFIKLYRSFMDWEWYHDNNVKVLFIHIILSANYENKNWKGIKIYRGQFVTSIKNLSVETSLSEQQIRTCLKKLNKSGEISTKTTNKYTVITVNNFNKFQNTNNNQIYENNSELYDKKDCIKNNSNKQIYNKKQCDNNLVTTTKEYIINKEYNNIYQYITDIYNETCVSYPRCTKLSDARIKSIKARLKKFSVDDFKVLFNKAQNSDYLKGANKYNWCASFDWLIADKNFAKVID